MADSHSQVPVPGYSDQRYYHFAILEGRRLDFGAKWLRAAIGRRGNLLSPGRFSSRPDEEIGRSQRIWTDLEFLRIREVDSFTGSLEARNKLESPTGSGCDYDIFVGELRVSKDHSGTERTIGAVGTGYAALTAHIVKQLVVSEQLASKAEFCIPTLRALLNVSRKKPKVDDPMELVITGINAVMPGSKRISSVRMSGPGVLRDGLYDVVEAFLASLGGNPQEGTAVGEASGGRPAKALPRALRLRGTVRMTDRDSSVTLGRDGSLRLWLRKNGTNIVQFGAIIRELIAADLFERTTSHPKWSEDSIV